MVHLLLIVECLRRIEICHPQSSTSFVRRLVATSLLARYAQRAWLSSITASLSCFASITRSSHFSSLVAAADRNIGRICYLHGRHVEASSGGKVEKQRVEKRRIKPETSHQILATLALRQGSSPVALRTRGVCLGFRSMDPFASTVDRQALAVMARIKSIYQAAVSILSNSLSILQHRLPP